MADIAAQNSSPSSAVATTQPTPGSGLMVDRFRELAGTDIVRRALPALLGVGVLAAGLLAYSTLAPSPQRMLYSQLEDGERATVISALEQARVDYSVNNATGAITVDENDFYRARMLVASDGGLAAPQGGVEMLDSLPMGASRVLEGERLRVARERDLMLTIRAIDGVESVRVHLAEGEKSVFVRENVKPSASVMLRLARGRSLSEGQTSAIVNLVAGSVPGLSIDAVRVIDQHGRLLSQPGGADNDGFELQTRMEHKLRTQIVQLLTPMLGADSFSSEIQVELDMVDVTSARESYDKDGVVRSETQAESTRTGTKAASGVPGALANTPPADPQAKPGPPQGTEGQGEQQAPVTGESTSTRTYELGREVSVSNQQPGRIRRISVAVAISKDAMKGAKPADIEQLQQLVGAAVGANEKRGDQVKVMLRSFEPVSEEEIPFYETGWFASIVRYGAGIIALLLVLLLGVRPLVKGMKRPGGNGGDGSDKTIDSGEPGSGRPASAQARALGKVVDRGMLDEKIGLARRLVAEQPDSAVAALRQMLNEQPDEAEESMAGAA